MGPPAWPRSPGRSPPRPYRGGGTATSSRSVRRSGEADGRAARSSGCGVTAGELSQQHIHMRRWTQRPNATAVVAAVAWGDDLGELATPIQGSATVSSGGSVQGGTVPVARDGGRVVGGL